MEEAAASRVASAWCAEAAARITPSAPITPASAMRIRQIRITGALFPKFASSCGAPLCELRKQVGTSKSILRSAAFDLKFLLRYCGARVRNFKSAALRPLLEQAHHGGAQFRHALA